MPVGLKAGLIIGGVVVGLLVVGLGLFLILDNTGGGNAVAAGLGTFNNTLRHNDPRDPVRGFPCNFHQVNFVAGRTYTIDMMSQQMDCFLRLENGQGLQIAANDDGGIGLNSRIIFRAQQSGPFRIICTTCAGGVGNYTLIVREN